MVIVRCFVTQQRLQKPVNIGGAEEILAARDKSNVLPVIVHGDAEMIAGRDILAGQGRVSAWNKDPVIEVIGIQLGPR